MAVMVKIRNGNKKKIYNFTNIDTATVFENQIKKLDQDNILTIDIKNNDDSEVPITRNPKGIATIAYNILVKNMEYPEE